MAETNNNSSKLKVNEVIEVTPFSDSDSTLTTTSFILPLTYFDTLWLNFPPVERLFFFEFTNLTSDFFNSVILPKLKHSLSLTLLHYLPLAGNITWPSLPNAAEKPAICYSPKDGVSVTVAVSSNANFALLSGNGIREAIELQQLTTQLSISDDKAEVISIQITLFPNEGFSIGISSHHAVLDGKSSTSFMKSWAYLCKQLQLQQNPNPSLLPEQLTPCFDRTVIKDPEGLDMLCLKHWMSFWQSDSNPNPRSLKILPMINAANPSWVLKTFDLSSDDIKKLRDKANKFGKSKQVPYLSSFVLTWAHVFVCLVKAKGIEANKSVRFIVAADCRSRLDPPIPRNYFGNCVDAVVMDVEAKDLIMEETGFALAAEKLCENIKRLKEDIVERSKDRIVEMFGGMKHTGQVVMSVAGSHRFEVYGSDFGWGKPKKVEIVSVTKTGAISLAESTDGSSGFEIGVVLEKQQMEVFVSLFSHVLK